MGFRFKNYDVTESRICGEQFKQDFCGYALSKNPEWTKGILQWFRDSAADGIRTFPAGSDGEFMVDLCHTTYPADKGAVSSVSWYERAMAGECRMKLALESEWGKGSGNQSLGMVLNDACKLALLRAQVKVVIFSSHRNDVLSRVSNAIGKLRDSHADRDPWLLIDAREKAGPPWDIHHEILVN